MSQPVFLVEFSAKVWPKYFGNGVASATGSGYNSARAIPIDPAKTYRFTCTVRRTGVGAAGIIYAGVALLDAAGATIAGDDSVTWFYVAGGVTPGDWTTYTATFGFGTARTFPGTAVTMVPLFILAFSGVGGAVNTSRCKEAWIEDTADPGVPISRDPYMRDLSAWSVRLGTPAVHRVEVDGTPQTLPLHYATGGYVSHAADTPASAAYEARVINPGFVRSELPVEWAGPIASNYGEIVLSNADGALGDWPHYGLGGSQVSVFYGQANAARSTFRELIRATIEQATVDLKTARLRLRGPESVLDKPILPNRYAGNNALPNGLEGTPDDLIGSPKPRLYGVAWNIAPPCVNTSRLIYQVHDSVASRAPFFRDEDINVTELRVRGLALTAGADYTNQADMETNAPAANQYRVWPRGGYIRLGTAPAGQVTCDVERITATGPGEPRAVGWLFDEIATDMGCANVRAWPASTPPVQHVGLWVNDLRTAAEVLKRFAVSIGAWMGYVRWDGASSNALELGMEVFPNISFSGLVLEPGFTEGDISSVQTLAAPSAGRGVPAWRVELGFSQNHTPSTSDMDAGVSAAARAALAANLKRVQASATATRDLHPLAREFLRDTVLVDAADAAAEADRLLSGRRYAMQWFEITVPLAAALAHVDQLRIGAHLALAWPGLQVLTLDGVIQPRGYFTVMALEHDMARQWVRMTVRQLESF